MCAVSDPIIISEQLALCGKATPGPWCWESHGQKSNDWTVGYAEDDNGKPLTGEIREPDFVVEAVGNSEPAILRKRVVIEQENSSGYSDATYIAACSPDRVARLCEFIADVARASLVHPIYAADVATLLARHGITLERRMSTPKPSDAKRIVISLDIPADDPVGIIYREGDFEGDREAMAKHFGEQVLAYVDALEDDETIEMVFIRHDMTDAEFDAIPET